MLLGGLPLLALSLYREGGELSQRLPELTGVPACHPAHSGREAGPCVRPLYLPTGCS